MSKKVTVSIVDSIIDQMAAAIQSFEGWYPGSHSFRNNNPGNLRHVTGLPGQIGLDETGHIIFDSYESGLAALKHQISIAFSGASHVYSPDDSLYDFFGKYAEGNSSQYAQYVANQLGVDPSASLKDLIV